jgi:NADPH:quinone reductase-like Zn-dependent oxidoreductase
MGRSSRILIDPPDEQLSGLKVFTTASPKNFDYVKSIGADFVVDYRDPEAPKKIREASGDKIAHGTFDFFSLCSSL